MELEAKRELLMKTLADLGSVMVAYSGGTDSAYLAYAAHHALGERMLAVIADSPSLPRTELARALDFAQQHGDMRGWRAAHNATFFSARW